MPACYINCLLLFVVFKKNKNIFIVSVCPESCPEEKNTTVSNLLLHYLCNVIVKKVLIIILSLQVILPVIWLQDIAHLPVFVVHYFQHHQSTGHIHFSDFIALHYDNSKEHEQDGEHHNLPFRHHDLNLEQSSFPVAIVNQSFFITGISLSTVSKSKIAVRQHFHSSVSLSAIWRPPKFA